MRELSTLNQQAEASWRQGEADQAARLITEGEGLSTRLLAVPQPTRAALEAASDLDDLYGRMLLSNRHYGWARMLFQKNAARWRRADQADAAAVERSKRAEAQIADCDRRMAE